MSEDVVGRARQRSQSEPVVLATVVWRRAPSSGKVGGKAMIAADGGVTGWLGGACAEPLVVREAMSALVDGEPRLMFLGPADELEGRQRDGMVLVPISCQSEGAIEVYLEPMLPAPHLVTIGRSPAVDTLAELARALGWRAVIVDEEGDPEAHPGEVLTSLEEAAASVGPRSMVLVGTQGHYDETALEAVLATPAAYVGLVASRKRAQAVLGYLRQRGVSDADLARVHAPAGLDLGRIAHQEIAVAVLGQLVQLRAAGLGAGAPPAAPAQGAPATEGIDPICGMTVQIAGARHRLDRDGEVVLFCCAGCLAAFEAQEAAAAKG